MHSIFWYILSAMAFIQIVILEPICPKHPKCKCKKDNAIELQCKINGQNINIHLLPNVYISLSCEEMNSLEEKSLPTLINGNGTFQSVILKDCPLPSSSFKDIMTNLGISRTSALIFQNSRKQSGYLEQRHFAGLHGLSKLLLSTNEINFSKNVFEDIGNITWLHIHSKDLGLSFEVFKPLFKLKTLEISYSQMSNITSNVFSRLTSLKKLSLWQNNVTELSEDFFTGINILEELDFSSSDMKELPTNIFKPLRKLKKLTLFSNTFSSLPMNLFQNNIELNTIIILNNNVKLKQIPKHFFGNLPKLKQVYVHNCGLANIPFDTFKNSTLITDISLSHNDIRNLPISVFNDQIDLLELNLSKNKINKLDNKIFSSLLRLEKLDLCYNLLEEISGITFSPLLSLVYLNLEHNRLKTISSCLFPNSKQKITINLAYNKLNFETNTLKNNIWDSNNSSPFKHTFNLRLLNLSHNNFKESFFDWFFNGHDMVDLRNNKIKNFGDENIPYPKFDKRIRYLKFPKIISRQIWISNNAMECDCKNLKFINLLQDSFNIKVADLHDIPCYTWIKQCDLNFIIYFSISIILVVGIIVTVILCIIYRKTVYVFMKQTVHEKYFINKSPEDEIYDVYLEYAKEDEQFVFEKVLPVLKHHKHFKIQTHLILIDKNNTTINSNIPLPFVKNKRSIILFTPNYLTSVYFDVNVREIQGKILKTGDVIYVFVDIGPENSIYLFLKEQRNRKTTLLWGELDFWNSFFKILFDGDGKIKKTLKIRSHRKKNPLKLSTRKKILSIGQVTLDNC